MKHNQVSVAHIAAFGSDSAQTRNARSTSPGGCLRRNKCCFIIVAIVIVLGAVTALMIIAKTKKSTMETKSSIGTTTISTISTTPILSTATATTVTTTTVTTSTVTTATTTTARETFVPLRGSSIDIHPNARWQRDGVTVAGGNGKGTEDNQLSSPQGLYVDDEGTVYVTDRDSCCVMEWKQGASTGHRIVNAHQLQLGSQQTPAPFDVIVDKATDSLVICDNANQRVVRWPRGNGASGQVIIPRVDCQGLTMGDDGSLYVVNTGAAEVKRYRKGDSQGTLVAGGNGVGDRLDQLYYPHSIFVDRNHAVYVSDERNNRVMKWTEGATQGIVVAINQGTGMGVASLFRPCGIVVDQLGTVYIANDGRVGIIRWPKEVSSGTVIVHGYGSDGTSSNLNRAIGLSFDRHGNLYVVDNLNYRVRKFNITQ